MKRSSLRRVHIASLVIVGLLARGDAAPAQAPATSAAPTPLTFTYKTVGSMPIQADVYQPADSGRRPVVVWVHPGALIMGSRAMLPNDELERLLRAGFVVVPIDYRLAPETKLPEILRDVEDALQWVRAQGAALFRADPNRVAIVGASGGAYLALLAAGRTQPPLRAVVSFYGYGDVAGEWYTRPDPFYAALPRVSRSEAMRAPSTSESSFAHWISGCPTR